MCVECTSTYVYGCECCSEVVSAFGVGTYPIDTLDWLAYTLDRLNNHAFIEYCYASEKRGVKGSMFVIIRNTSAPERGRHGCDKLRGYSVHEGSGWINSEGKITSIR